MTTWPSLSILTGRKPYSSLKGRTHQQRRGSKEDLVTHHGIPENITNVSIDMSPAFIRGTNDSFPGAAITCDKFNISKILNNAVDEVRKKEIRGAGDIPWHQVSLA